MTLISMISRKECVDGKSSPLTVELLNMPWNCVNPAGKSKNNGCVESFNVIFVMNS